MKRIIKLFIAGSFLPVFFISQVGALNLNYTSESELLTIM